jgi:hypothetical protein
MGTTASAVRVVTSETDTSVQNIRQMSANEVIAEITGTLVTQGREQTP